MKGNFQIIVLVVFIVAAVFGVLVFSGTIPLGNKKNQAGSQGTVVLWGTTSASAIYPLVEEFNKTNPTIILKYYQIPADIFDQTLLESLASGVGPDIFFIPDNLVMHYKNRIYPVPYESFSLSTFKNSFVSAGEVFLTSKGILAFPIAVDPLVMYYNRSALDANSIVYPPVYWDQFKDLVPLLTKKDDSKQIIKSTVALGQFSNITHAKDIIATLFMQTGNPIVSELGGAFSSSLKSSGGDVQENLVSALSFYTDFSNPLNYVYSWNKSLPQSKDFFSANNLAFYFGYSSELQSLISRNPNQNFSVAQIPQVRNSNFKLTSARVTGVAVSAFSKNFNTAFSVASMLATGDFARQLTNVFQIPPARRDLLSTKLTDAYYPTFFASALYARSWLDPSYGDTNNIFGGMIDKIISNDMQIRTAIADASDKLGLLLANYR
ncbi:MAG: extracellular solute-binding protein [Candidatus Paceibacterota bacterium]|jgi:multiple sugar transport system substrate-binding protein